MAFRQNDPDRLKTATILSKIYTRFVLCRFWQKKFRYLDTRKRKEWKYYRIGSLYPYQWHTSYRESVDICWDFVCWQVCHFIVLRKHTLKCKWANPSSGILPFEWNARDTHTLTNPTGGLNILQTHTHTPIRHGVQYNIQIELNVVSVNMVSIQCFAIQLKYTIFNLITFKAYAIRTLYIYIVAFVVDHH